ncbi:MAG TPA: hypothetical protein VJ124_01845 [Pyrinomonadaceae bacterium]|nr:hypothetical protein [Pyrinomonadaceae bacterium]
MLISAVSWLAGTASPLDLTIHTAVSFKGLPLADITILAVTRQLRPAATAVMLLVLLMRQELALRLMIERMIAIARARVVAGAASAFVTIEQATSRNDMRPRLIFISED